MFQLPGITSAKKLPIPANQSINQSINQSTSRLGASALKLIWWHLDMLLKENVD